MDFLDILMMRRPSDADDESLSYDRLVGDRHSNVLCFLPWRISFPLARRFQLLPKNFLACYEMPPAIVSSEPHQCVEALETIVEDALDLMGSFKVQPATAVFLGLSIGTAPATVLANRTGGRLCSVASADRGDLMLWQSPAAHEIKCKAERKGYRIDDFRRTFQGLNPVENLRNIKRDSIFITSEIDHFVPEVRRRALLHAVRSELPDARIIKSSRGHVRTILSVANQLPGLIAA
jgi:pimeloyl-ACP methyl ester carboxylesterase